jgi:hypothetical protein
VVSRTSKPAFSTIPRSITLQVAEEVAAPASTSTALDPGGAVLTSSPPSVASTPNVVFTGTQQTQRAVSSVSLPVTTQEAIQSSPSLQRIDTSSTLIADSSIASSSVSITPTKPATSSANPLVIIPVAQSVVVGPPAKGTNIVVTSIQASAEPLPSTPHQNTPQESSVATGLPSNNSPKIAFILGASLGGLALILLLSFFCLRYKKKKRISRDSLLTLLQYDTDGSALEKYAIDDTSFGAEESQASSILGNLRMDIAGIFSMVKTKLCRRNDTPGINMNRGNSQFLEPVSQHGHANIAVSSGRIANITVLKDRFGNLWKRVAGGMHFNLWPQSKMNNEDEMVDSFAITRNIKEEKPSSQITPDTQYLAIKAHEIQPSDGQLREYFGASQLAGDQSEVLGIDFGNPFADPSHFAERKMSNLSKSRRVPSLDPFADQAVDTPAPPKAVYSRPASSIYVSEVGRLSEQSERDLAQRLSLSQYLSTLEANQTLGALPSDNIASRYTSTIRTSRGTNRDTLFSNFSFSRMLKTRSDPFDLDNLDLSLSSVPMPK